MTKPQDSSSAVLTVCGILQSKWTGSMPQFSIYHPNLIWSIGRIHAFDKDMVLVVFYSQIKMFLGQQKNIQKRWAFSKRMW